jgi:DNA-binding PucR family transcriptional regulator
MHHMGTGDPPSPRVQQLLRQGARMALDLPPEWLAELDEATLSGTGVRQIADDPVLAAAIRRTNRSNLLAWAAANVRNPGVPVLANLGDEPLAIARDLVRRGLNESALDTYRVGQGVAERLWLRIAFSLTSDADELRQLLDVSLRSISAFVDATVVAISARMQAEREELTSGTNAERRELVTLLLGGAPVSAERAESALGYRLGGTHTAAVVWSEDVDADLGALDRVADVLAAAAGERRPLSVIAGAATRWVWVHCRLDAEQVPRAGSELSGSRVALGSAGPGLDGFRRSHLDALDTQRMLARLGPSPWLASHDQVELAALVTQDPARADRFVSRTLGDLETAPAEVVEAVRTYLAEQCSVARAAARLFAHRNTVLRRLARAEQLLPRPLAEHVLEVGVALDVLRWRGRP